MKDLPHVWQSALHTRAMSRCKQSALGLNIAPTVRVVGPNHAPILLVKDATYRCDQLVEAFIQRTPEGLYVLIQPIDMLCKDGAAKCSCFYDIALHLPIVIGTAPVKRDQVRAVLLRGDRYGLHHGEHPHVEEVLLGSHVPHVGSWWDDWKHAGQNAWSDYKETVQELW